MDERRTQAARRLVKRFTRGVLCTNSAKKPGFPFGSVTPYVVGSQGSPLFLVSGLALHTRNLLENPKASLFIFDPDPSGNPLSLARVNLLGEVFPVRDADQAALLARYLEVHREAAQWAGFGDFRMFRMTVSDLYYVGGFGEMGWASAEDYAEAEAE